MDEQHNHAEKKSQTGPIIAILGLILIIVVGVVAAQGLNKPETKTKNATSATQTQQTTTQQPFKETEGAATRAAMKASSYKDGTYSATGHYTSPGGAETLGVTLTIENGVVTDSIVEVKAFRPMSKLKQTDFAEHYKPQVIGKNIDEIKLVKVSGSSLAPKGFNEAVEQIKAEAKA